MCGRTRVSMDRQRVAAAARVPQERWSNAGRCPCSRTSRASRYNHALHLACICKCQSHAHGVPTCGGGLSKFPSACYHSSRHVSRLMLLFLIGLDTCRSHAPISQSLSSAAIAAVHPSTELVLQLRAQLQFGAGPRCTSGAARPRWGSGDPHHAVSLG